MFPPECVLSPAQCGREYHKAIVPVGFLWYESQLRPRLTAWISQCWGFLSNIPTHNSLLWESKGSVVLRKEEILKPSLVCYSRLNSEAYNLNLHREGVCSLFWLGKMCALTLGLLKGGSKDISFPLVFLLHFSNLLKLFLNYNLHSGLVTKVFHIIQHCCGWISFPLCYKETKAKAEKDVYKVAGRDGSHTNTPNSGGYRLKDSVIF